MSSRSAPSLLASLLAATLCLFQVWSVVFSQIDPLLHRALFLALTLSFAFAARPDGSSSRWDRVLSLASLGAGAYYCLVFDRIQWRWPLVDPLHWGDLAVALLLLFLVGELTRRYVGLPILLVALFFSSFLLLGHHLPGTFSHRYFSLPEYLDQMVYTINGLFGAPLAVAATYVYFFILFGIVLYRAGGGDFFIDLAKLLAARTQGGSAKVAVLSCGLFGMMSGSPTSDAVTTGTFTIPLMKRMGYRAEEAGAIVAAAATGGSIMPPVMGSAVFIMVELTGIPYLEIVVAATLPALLFYLSLLAQVHFRSRRLSTPVQELPTSFAQLRPNLHFLFPIAVLIYLLARGEIPTYAAAAATAAAIGTSWLRYTHRIGPTRLLEIMVESARASVTVAAATGLAGIVVGCIAFSGLGGKFTGILLNLAGQQMLPVLLLTMLLCIILGMGMPVPSAYILTAVLIGPTLSSLGLSPLPSHLFIIYFAVMSAITPPVAVAAYAVAGLAGGNPNHIGFQAMRLSLVAYLVPFLFVYQPQLLLQGDPGAILLSLLTACLGVVTLSAAAEGWMFGPVPLWGRLTLAAAGLALLVPGTLSDLPGLLLLCAVALHQKWHPCRP